MRGAGRNYILSYLKVALLILAHILREDTIPMVVPGVELLAETHEGLNL